MFIKYVAKSSEIFHVSQHVGSFTTLGNHGDEFFEYTGGFLTRKWSSIGKEQSILCWWSFDKQESLSEGLIRLRQ